MGRTGRFKDGVLLAGLCHKGFASRGFLGQAERLEFIGLDRPCGDVFVPVPRRIVQYAADDRSRFAVT